MRAKAEVPLPLATPPRCRRSRGGRERKTLYAAVLHLRKRGHRVYRGGDAHHVVDGRRVEAWVLLHMAGLAGFDRRALRPGDTRSAAS